MKPKLFYVDDEGRVSLEQFDQFLDITKVEYYSIEHLSDGKIALIFYDKDENVIKPFVC